MEDRFISETELGLYVDLDSGFSPKYEVAGDKFIVGGNGALVRLGKAVAFLLTHLELNVMSVLITYTI